MGGQQRAWAERPGMTAILIALPELAGYTDRWRSVSYSSARPGLPLSAIVPPHVTVLVPWLTDPVPEDVHRLSDAVAGVKPFDLWFGGVGRFADGTVYLRPEPFDEVTGLIRTVLAAFPECPPYGGEHPDPHPHLTIWSAGTAGSDEVIAAADAVITDAEASLAHDVPPSVRLDDLTIWREGRNRVWQLVGSVPLGSG